MMAYVPAILLLAACGGSSTSQPTTSGPLDANEVAQLLIDNNELFDDPDLLLTPESEFPASNSVVYNGTFAASSSFTALTSFGTMTMDVNFEDDTMTGAATNLYDGSGTPLIGTLDFTGGVIDGASASPISVNMSGELTRNGDPFSYGSGGVLTGEFLGDNAALMTANGTVSGTVDGTATVVTLGISGAKQE